MAGYVAGIHVETRAATPTLQFTARLTYCPRNLAAVMDFSECCSVYVSVVFCSCFHWWWWWWHSLLILWLCCSQTMCKIYINWMYNSRWDQKCGMWMVDVPEMCPTSQFYSDIFGYYVKVSEHYCIVNEQYTTHRTV